MIGLDALKKAIENAPSKSGVYKMYNNSNILIYVGKAKDIKKRLSSYSKPDLPQKTQALVELIANIEFEITQNEKQALILEASLIKNHQPKFNILLKDDKSRLYIKISKQEFPSISTYRGKFDRKTHLFGPFGYTQGAKLSASYTVKSIMDFTSRIFKIRSCKDTKLKIHKSMGKPCMEFQIGTCSAPCVGKISKTDYATSVENAIAFLRGGYSNFAKTLKEKITLHAQKQEFIEAQGLKNQLFAIENLRSQLDINFHKHENLDVIAINQNLEAVEVFSIRNGYALGGNVFEITKQELPAEEILEKFILQHYSNQNTPPKEIFVNQPIQCQNIQEALSEVYNTPCKISFPQKGEKKQMIDFVLTNLEHQTQAQQKNENIFEQGIQMLTQEIGLKTIPERIEVYDNSHTSGSFFVGAFIVFGRKGFIKNEYRKFNAKFSKGGDDYAMMQEVMLRRFNENSSIKTKPDLLIIDGGLGQFSTVFKTLKEMSVSVPVISIAKGEYRNAGKETFFTEEKKGFKIENQKLHYFLQTVRDEAHRFAITSHRKRREKI